MICNNISDAYQMTFDFIEEHLLDVNLLTKLEEQDFFSVYHIGRSFSDLSGHSISEYIRSRRFTTLALMILENRFYDPLMYKIVNYKDKRSFERAFHDFHGCLPQDLLEHNCSPKIFQKYHVTIQLSGGDSLEYSVIDKPSFTVFGNEYHFLYENSNSDIPSVFIKEFSHVSDSFMYTIAMDNGDGISFKYILGRESEAIQKVYSVSMKIPALKWLVFSISGQFPYINIQTRKKIFSEIIPGLYRYRLSGKAFVEKFYPGDPHSDIFRSEIWIPVEDIKEED